MKALILPFILFIGIQFAEAQPLKKGAYWNGGTLHIINSSHQDIGWMDTPEACIQFRDEKMITPALKRLAENPDYCFSVEDALCLEEYLERHPERYEEILKYTKEGRLEWGATYNQPYMSMYDGEALVRQTYYGRKWLKKMLPGCDFKAAWSQDVPGVALQFPQILAKSGIPYYQFSRHQPGVYKWFSPDGSSILAWTTGQYDEAGIPIRSSKTDVQRTDSFAVILNSWTNYFSERKLAPHYPFIYSFDFSQPLNWDEYMKTWNSEVKKENPKNLPMIKYSTSTMAMDELAKRKEANYVELMGERPNVWLYIHGPTHYRAMKAARTASRTLAAAEIFSTFNAMQEKSFSNYPQALLFDSWRRAIYPDHGWGGNHGDITDRLFRTQFEKALCGGTHALKNATEAIAKRIAFKTESKQAITLFNPLSWERTDPVSVTIDVEGRTHNHFVLEDAAGREIPYQLIASHDRSINNDEVLTLHFVAEKIPAMGYKTYYLAERKESVSTKYNVPDPSMKYENRFYTITFGKGGISSLFDKELKKEVFNTTKFNGGEIFTMKSVGNGAGEFTEVQQPTMEDYDKLGNYSGSWQCVEAGAVRDVFQLIQPMKENQAVLRLVIYKTIKRIDFETEINGFSAENWREFRLAFPMNQPRSKVAYEVPMGVVEVGKDEIKGAAGFSKPSQIYSTPCKDVHPREVQNWFSSTDGKTACTISSDVAVFDWIDPTTSPVDYVVLQPILLASRKSCHGLGNYYLQPGNHSYRFSLYSHPNDWKSGYRLGTQSMQPLVATVTKTNTQAGSYPEEFSFLQTQGNGVLVSTIKKAEDDDSVILRCFDIEGKDTSASFELFIPIRKAGQTNLIEEEETKIPFAPNGFTTKIGHNSIETFKIALE